MYLPSLGEGLTPAQSKLCGSLVIFYSDCLLFRADTGKYYERSTGERVARSLYELSDRRSNPLKAIDVKEMEVEKLALIVQAERARQTNTTVTTLQHQTLASFDSSQALLHSFEKPFLRVSNSLVLFHDTPEFNKHWNFIQWLSSDDYRDRHDLTYQDVVPGTTQWIISKPEYQKWQTSSASPFLWLHGIPGRGKTTLTSSVIQQYLDAAQENDQSAPVAHVYCSNGLRKSSLRRYLLQLPTDAGHTS